MAGIFVCYRRADAEGWAGRLYDSLTAELGRTRIFRDIDDIPPGVEFDTYINDAVSSCDVLIALIGPRWLTVTDRNGLRRLDDPKDFTRLEILAALKRNVRVIPALVGGMRMPDADELPEDLKPLARRQAYELSDTRWNDDCRKLVDVLPIVKPKPWRKTAMLAVALAALMAAGYAINVWNDRKQRAQEAAQMLEKQKRDQEAQRQADLEKQRAQEAAQMLEKQKRDQEAQRQADLEKQRAQEAAQMLEKQKRDQEAQRQAELQRQRSDQERRAEEARGLFSKPMLGQYRLDWCRTLGQDCGPPAASEWCRRKGYAAALNWEIDRNVAARGVVTQTIGKGELCRGGTCDSFSSITCKTSGRFVRPMLGEYRLDWCHTLGQDCGQPVALTWCQKQGFSEVIAFGPEPNVAFKGIVTKTIGSGQLCRVGDCMAFNLITCR